MGSKYHYKWAIIGPPAKRHVNGRRWPNIECWLSSFVIFQGIRTSTTKKTFSFVIFQGGGGGPDPMPPSGSAHAFLSQMWCTDSYVHDSANTQQ